MPKPDFAFARIMHIAWKASLREFLDGKKSPTLEQDVCHKECDLGKWLYSEGLDQYGKIPEVKELEKAHVELYSIVKKTLQFKKSGNTFSAEKEYEKMDKISSKIFSLLVKIEKEVNSS
jgi:methyl-accepting chemotaxis protein